MKIWIDADACPGAVKEIIVKAAVKRSVLAVFVASKETFIPPSPHLSTIRTAVGPDIADQYILSQAQAGDLVITQDIPLASELITIGSTVISPYGVLLDLSNIGVRLSNRNFSQELRDMGLPTSGPPPFGEKEKRQFANTFDQALTRLLKQ